jgi:hypothetical protein
VPPLKGETGDEIADSLSSRHAMPRARSPPEDPATNLKVLPARTRVHGEGPVMEDFREALMAPECFRKALKL